MEKDTLPKYVIKRLDLVRRGYPFENVYEWPEFTNDQFKTRIIALDFTSALEIETIYEKDYQIKTKVSRDIFKHRAFDITGWYQQVLNAQIVKLLNKYKPNPPHP